LVQAAGDCPNFSCKRISTASLLPDATPLRDNNASR